MPSKEFPNPYKLIGENAPVTLIVGLLLFGTIGSVAATRLLLPPDLKMETLVDWVSQSKSEEIVLASPPAVIDTMELSAVKMPQHSTAEPMSPPTRESQSQQGISERKLDITSSVSARPIDTAVAAVPGAETVEHKALRVDEQSIDIHSESFSVSPVTTAEPLFPLPSKDVVQAPTVKSDEPRAAEQAEAELGLSQMSAVAPAAGSGTLVDSVESDVIETSGRSQARLAAVNMEGCAPLFFVQFKRGSTRPIDVDLSEKAVRLRDWLSLNPETKVIIEGHTDSSGPEELNLLISHRRAKAVAELLAGAGVANRQMVKHALGEYSPLAGVPADSARNRRVSLRVEGAAPCPEFTSDGEM